MVHGQTTTDVMIMAGFNNINTAIWELMGDGINRDNLISERVEMVATMEIMEDLRVVMMVAVAVMMVAVVVMMVVVAMAAAAAAMVAAVVVTD